MSINNKKTCLLHYMTCRLHLILFIISFFWPHLLLISALLELLFLSFLIIWRIVLNLCWLETLSIVSFNHCRPNFLQSLQSLQVFFKALFFTILFISCLYTSPHSHIFSNPPVSSHLHSDDTQHSMSFLGILLGIFPFCHPFLTQSIVGLF